ncbi:hypothetical protein PF010_g31016 [Phytophthora fragariae]|uniref:Uncharacterized protein n=1 Tax=Phytophthora fragariae TaxID=53985 RepID=A0A6A4AWE1_9STRA|nr:hypothetical protein PF009_g32034 [Phytophthora fragariae]KAE9058402.1 hypothetical protein PF010_g31016 [Phytophthora fragariae]KAE9059351.1 hypothetical protein PF007_g30988 [Phytophthora fragariae]KAE9264970.1 hypothetical protein PF001_g31077 [Phytophthora fragariae]
MTRQMATDEYVFAKAMKAMAMTAITGPAREKFPGIPSVPMP